MIQHEYMTMKLMNGDNIICVMISENDEKFTIMYPIQMKTTRIELEGKQKEILAGSPWCSFTDDNIFDIYKQDVIILKPMNESTIQYYKNMVDVQQITEPENQQSSHADIVNEFSDNFFFIDGNNTFN